MVGKISYEFVDINKTSNSFINFLDLEMKRDENFKYFSSRSIDVLDNHLITILLISGTTVLGYGHIDLENRKWLGVYVSLNHRGKSLGKIIINELLKRSKKIGLDTISLSVFKTNTIAINLYKNLGFEVYKKSNESVFMKINI